MSLWIGNRVICLLLLIAYSSSSNRLSYNFNKAAPPFVWEIPDNERWFHVTSLLPNIPIEQQETPPPPYPPVFAVSPRFFTNDMVQKFSRNTIRSLPATFHQFPEVRKQFIKDFLFQDIYNTHRQLIIANNVSVDTHGHVFDRKLGKFLANGGCHQRFNPGEIPPSARLVYRLRVISIAAMWTHAPFHFPIEAVAGLAHLNDTLLRSTPIHISHISNYTLGWLSLLQIPVQHIITGTVFASELLLPEMSRCGAPSLLQLQWMRDQFLPLAAVLPQHPPHIVIIKRTTSRVFNNFSGVYSTISGVASKYNLSVMVHSEANLPSLLEQINIFSTAALVVTSHGAAELFITFMPAHACVIEYNYLYSSNLVYARMALLLGLNYRMNVMGEITMDSLAEQVGECLTARQKSLKA